MTNKFIFFSVVIIVIILAASLRAGGSIGVRSGEFLNISPDARGEVFGSAWVAAAEGSGTLFYNPAALAGGKAELSFSHLELYQDLKLENFSAAVPIGVRRGIGFALTYLGYGNILGYDNDGNMTGALQAHSMLISVAVAHKIGSHVAVGFSAKPLFEQLGGYSAAAMTFDLGVLIRLKQFTIGAQAANLGGSLTFFQESVPLVSSLRLGIAYQPIGSHSSIIVGGTANANNEYRLNAGIEYAYNSLLTFRTGYDDTFSGSSAADGFGFGLGINPLPFGFNYAYRDGGNISGIHYITFSYQFVK